MPAVVAFLDRRGTFDALPFGATDFSVVRAKTDDRLALVRASRHDMVSFGDRARSSTKDLNIGWGRGGLSITHHWRGAPAASLLEHAQDLITALGREFEDTCWFVRAGSLSVQCDFAPAKPAFTNVNLRGPSVLDVFDRRATPAQPGLETTSLPPHASRHTHGRLMLIRWTAALDDEAQLAADLTRREVWLRDIFESNATRGRAKRRGKRKVDAAAGRVPAAQQEALVKAARLGQHKKLESLLREGVPPSARSEKSWAAMDWACTRDDLKSAQLLVEHGLDVNAPTSQDGPTPLYLASRNKSARVARWLVEQGADVNAASGEDGAPPLHAAIYPGHEDIKLRFGRKGSSKSKPDPKALAALEARRLEMIAFLIDHGADVDRADSKGFTPLDAALGFERYPEARLLMTRGADPTLRQREGVSTLWSLAQRGEIAEFEWFMAQPRTRELLEGKK